MINYLYLLLAIIAEVVATTALKSAEGFTKFIPSIIVIIGYAISFYLLSIILEHLPLGITYAIWAGLGIVFVAVAGIFIYGQKPDLAAMIGIILIISGVVIIQLFSQTTGH